MNPTPFLVLAVAVAGACPPAFADAWTQRRIEALRALTPPRPEDPPPPTCAPRSFRGRRDRERVDRAIRDASLRFAVDAALIRAVIRAESGGDPTAVSAAGAVGLMQLMPATARNLGVVCRFDARENVMGGTRYLRRLRDLLGSWRRAVAGYHAGPRRVWEQRLPAVTERYVERVMSFWRGRCAGGAC